MRIVYTICTTVVVSTEKERTVYKTIRVKNATHRDLAKFRNLYSLQDGKDYSLDDTINLLIRDRVGKQFILPVTKDKKEALQTY